jgi:probable HAF family extracellular repeat protein
MRRITCALIIVAVQACGHEPQVTRPLAVAKPTASVTLADRRYDVVTYPSLGGAQSRGTAISNSGYVAGFSFLPNGTRRAALWVSEDSIANLGTLGGPNSSVPWPGVNNRGWVVGISQTGELDPNNESWSCEEGGFLPVTNPKQICRGFAYYDGEMHPLPTLGGTHGFATEVNSRGQVVGWAETAVFDNTCNGIQKLQFLGVLWEPARGAKQALPPYPGDRASAATAINENGVVVGISGRCDQAVGRFSALRAVIWDHGDVDTLPTLGGVTWHTPMDINEMGDVVGFSNPPGPGDPNGDFIAQAFYWKKGSPTVVKIGTLVITDPVSEAFAINSRGQVVGISFGGPSGARAFLWEDGKLANLNDLADVAPNVLLSAQDINDEGQITGRIRMAATGEVRTFVATPLAPQN